MKKILSTVVFCALVVTILFSKPMSTNAIIGTCTTNLPPIVNCYCGSVCNTQIIRSRLVANDPEGDNLTFTIISGLPNPSTQGTLILDSATGYFTFTPVIGYTGTISFIFQVSDGKNKVLQCGTLCVLYCADKNTTCNTQNTTCSTTSNTTANTTSNTTANTTSNTTKNTTNNTTANTTSNTTKNTTSNTTVNTTKNTTSNTTVNTTSNTTVNTTSDTTANTTKNTTANTTYDTTANTTKNTTANTTCDTTANTTKNTTVNTTYDTTANTTKNTTANTTCDTTVNTTKNTTANTTCDTTANTTKNTTYNTTVNTTKNTTANTTCDTTVNTTKNTTANTTCDTTVNTTKNTTVNTTINTTSDTTANTTHNTTMNTTSNTTSNTSSNTTSNSTYNSSSNSSGNTSNDTNNSNTTCITKDSIKAYSFYSCICNTETLYGELKAVDSNGKSLTYTIISGMPNEETQGTLTLDEETGEFIFIPASGYLGEFTFIYEVTNGTIKVQQIGTIKVIYCAGNASDTSNSTYNSSSNTSGNTSNDTNNSGNNSNTTCIIKDSIKAYSYYACIYNTETLNGKLIVIDSNGKSLTYTIISGMPNPDTQGTLTLNEETGEFIFTPVPGYVGEFTFIYEVTNGTIKVQQIGTIKVIDCSDTSSNSTSNSSSITSGNTSNDTNNSGNNGNTTCIIKDSIKAYSYYACIYNTETLNGKLIATDSNSKSLTYTIISGMPNEETQGTLTLNEETGEFTFIPVPGYVGEFTFIYEVTNGTTKVQQIGTIKVIDCSDTSSNSTSNSSSNTSGNTSNDTNNSENNSNTTCIIKDSIKAYSYYACIYNTEILNGKLIAIDSNSKSLTYTIISGMPNPDTQGTLTLDEKTGEFIFIPVPGYVGEFTFIYEVTNGTTKVQQMGTIKVIDCSHTSSDTSNSTCNSSSNTSGNTSNSTCNSSSNTSGNTSNSTNSSNTTCITIDTIEAYSYYSCICNTEILNGQLIATDSNGSELTYKIVLGMLNEETQGTLTLDEETGEFVFIPVPGYVGEFTFIYEVTNGTTIVQQCGTVKVVDCLDNSSNSSTNTTCSTNNSSSANTTCNSTSNSSSSNTTCISSNSTCSNITCITCNITCSNTTCDANNSTCSNTTCDTSNSTCSNTTCSTCSNTTCSTNITCLNTTSNNSNLNTTCITISTINAYSYSQEIYNDQTLNGQLVATDSDGNPLTYKIVSGMPDKVTQGTLLLDELTGKFVFTPLPGFADAINFIYQVTNGITTVQQVGTIYVKDCTSIGGNSSNISYYNTTNSNYGNNTNNTIWLPVTGEKYSNFFELISSLFN